MYGIDRIACIPRIDTGEPFGGMSNRKRRITKIALRVINTAGVEVGVRGHPLTPVKDLKGDPRTGEFEVPILSDTDTESEIMIRQSDPAPFCLTSLTVHMQVEG